MHIPRRLRIMFLAITAGVVPLLLALTIPAQPDTHGSSRQLETPQQVADTLDSIVQPRFQQNAGRFGMSRNIDMDGHEAVAWVDANNPHEKQRFAAIKASHRSYILAFLHCRHKPGAHIDPPTKPQEPDNFTPYMEALMAVGGTQKGAQKMYDWADKSLAPVVLTHLSDLKSGKPAQIVYQNWVVIMRPVRALHQSCINCHTGARRGDTLGAMVYVVDENSKIKGSSFIAPGGE